MTRRVHVLGTGGTIAGAQPDPGHHGYVAAAFGVDWLLRAVPGLDRLAQLSGEQVVNIGSQDMDDAVWLKLARRLDAVLASPDTDAVLITHGTDTLEETAYFLDLVTASDKPIVVVGSMRPATAISADGPANIYNGVAVAADPRAVGRGTLVCLNDEIHYARNAVKTGTSNPSAFSSMARGLAGIASAGRVEWFANVVPQPAVAVRFPLAGLDSLPRVDILHAHANMSLDMIDAAIAGGAQGLVIAGVGAGNVSARAIERLHAAAAAGVVVVRSSRVVSAMVLRNHEIDDDRFGFVAAGDLNAPKSRVLLQLALTQTRDVVRIQELFDRC
ncbi:MAG TPA: type II asparaginase [Steroidobacteraceae bacterium]